MIFGSKVVENFDKNLKAKIFAYMRYVNNEQYGVKQERFATPILRPIWNSYIKSYKRINKNILNNPYWLRDVWELKEKTYRKVLEVVENGNRKNQRRRIGKCVTITAQ